MALIRVPQHRPEDLAAWERLEHEDAAWAMLPEFRARCVEAVRVIREFAGRGPCYASTSWGKDSVVVAHLVWTLLEEEGLDIPLAWVRVEPIENPHCVVVRDTFLSRWPMPFREVVIRCPQNDDGTYHAPGTLEAGIEQLYEAYGPRWIGGLRGEESGMRARRIDRGLSLRTSCQPIGHWTDRDVFAYLCAFDLPVHPVYAMSFGGSLDRGRLRVSSLGLRRDTRWLGQRGAGHGRAEWEDVYYGSSDRDSR